MNQTPSKDFLSAWIDLYSLIEAIAATVDIPNEWRKRIGRCAFARLPEQNFDPWRNHSHRNQAWRFRQDMRMAYRFWKAIEICRRDLIEGQALQLRDRIDGDGNVEIANSGDHGNALRRIYAIESAARRQIDTRLENGAAIISILPFKSILITTAPPSILDDADEAWLKQQLFDRDLVIATLPDDKASHKRLLDIDLDVNQAERRNNFSQVTLHDQHVRTYERTQLDSRIAELSSLPRLLGDFISLDDVVEQVGRGVELADDEVEGYLPRIGIQPSPEDQPFRAIREHPVRKALQRAQTAFILLDHLFNDRGVRHPRWVELSSHDGARVMNDAVAVEGRKELERLGICARNYLSELSGGMNFSDRYRSKGDASVDEKSLPGSAVSAVRGGSLQIGAQSLQQGSRLRSIGFYRSDLVKFLNKVGIRHQIRSRHVVAEHDLPSDDDRTAASRLLMRDATKKPLPEGLSTRDLAASLMDADDCKYSIGRDWLAYLQKSPPKWAVDPKSGIRIHAGAPGRRDTSIWHPLKFAIAAVQKFKRVDGVKMDKHRFFLAIDERFRRVELLSPWRDEWVEWRTYTYKPMRENDLNRLNKPGI